MMKKSLLRLFGIGFIAGSFFACSGGSSSEEESAGVVNVYTHRHYEADQQLFDRFTEETGIRVNVVSASADELIQKLEIEGASSPADVLITVDAGRLYRAQEKDLLQPVSSSTLEAAIPAKFREPAGYWFGLTYRARILAYHKERVSPEELSSYEALADPQWKGRILTRSSENIYNQSLMASIIEHNGEEAASAWASAVLDNLARAPKGGDRDQVKAIASGEGDVAIVNTYYIGLMLNDDNAEERKAAEQIEVFFPNQDDRGTHVNISGAGVTKYAPNKENAIKFIEFLANKESQQFLANINYEYPVREDVAFSEQLKKWGAFKSDDLNLSILGENNQRAVVIFDQVGWK
ncbi:extracellular solute-binding protein [Nitritalea halalkaliphila LW7]|uniref:Extracellular solute-binding protein n=1 Tax=Nitritalea halalkaliphila LW7 TaxID=1189621 RepID=I5C5I7_9BACT|nr:Fe(3+) ABC transporter substrate-binding protein [Nitritalea halalkaliphila]EIM77089.1 extracellular solute-binding protein [Nitritalea halalkaliphila LW7]